MLEWHYTSNGLTTESASVYTDIRMCSLIDWTYCYFIILCVVSMLFISLLWFVENNKIGVTKTCPALVLQYIPTIALACCSGQTEAILPTLLHKSTIDNPDGTLKWCGDGRGWMSSCAALATHSLDAPEQEDHDAHHGDSCGDARPHCQIKWG